MKKYLILFPAVLAFILIANNSSAQDDPLFSHIAPDASAIYRINLPRIFSKIDWADVESHIPAAKTGSKNKEWMDLLKDPSRSGIDMKANVLITSSVKDVFDSVNSTTFILHLTDSSKFRILLRKQYHGLRITRYPGGSYSAYVGKDGMVWNKDLAVVVTVRSSINDAMATAMAQANPDNKMNSQAPKHQEPNYEAIAVSAALHTLKGWATSPLTDDPDFKEAFSNDADFQSYTKKMSFSKYMKGFQKLFPDSMFHGLNMDSLSTTRNSSLAVWFENGKIRAKYTMTLQPNIAEFMERASPPALNPDLLARIPKGNLLALASLRINLSTIPYMLDRIGVKDKLNEGLAKKGISMEDFGKAFKGDLLFVVKEPEHTDSFQKPKPVIYFVASIGDMASVNKLGVALGNAKDSVLKPGMMGGDSMRKSTFLGKVKNNFVIKDNILVFGDNKGTADGYFANTEKRNDDMLIAQLKESPTFLWIDLHELVNFMAGPVRNDAGDNPQIKMINAVHSLDKLIMKSSNMHNGKVLSEFELSVTRTDQNILKTIMDMAPAPKH